MNLSTDATRLSIADYLGEPNAIRRLLLPETPALYVWTRGFPVRHLGNVLLMLSRPTRTLVGHLPPFYSITVSDCTAGMTPAKIEAITTMGQEDYRNKWALELLRKEQRPLYIGITLNLRQRISTHLRPGSVLRSYLEEAALGPTDCDLHYYPIPNLPGVPLAEEWDREEGIEPPDSQDTDLKNAVDGLRITEALLLRFAQPLLNRAQE